MRTRTLERLRWLSVLCLVGAALMFLCKARTDDAYHRQSITLASPAAGGVAIGDLLAAFTTRYRIETELPLPPAREDPSLRVSDVPDVPSALHAEFRPRDGKAFVFEAPAFHFDYGSGSEAWFVSDEFVLPERGEYTVSIEVGDGGLPSGRSLRIAPVEVFYYLPELMRLIGWLAFAIGSALWFALAFARRYARPDVVH